MSAEHGVSATLSFTDRSDGRIDMSFIDDETGEGYVLPISHTEYAEMKSRLALADHDGHLIFLDFMDWLKLVRGSALGRA